MNDNYIYGRALQALVAVLNGQLTHTDKAKLRGQLGRYADEAPGEMRAIWQRARVLLDDPDHSL